jgi:undecaprenyl-diphosphatase
MSFWTCLILGFIEGLTEFLPVSSTFHLLAAGRLLGVGAGEFVKLFDVVIQSGAILAVVLLYWKKLRTDFNLVKKTLAAFVPTAVLGVLAYRTIKEIFFESDLWMTGIFIAVGFVFLLFEGLVRRGRIRPERPLSDLTYKNAIIIGLAQCLAFFPGVSRAGAVILVMMLLGFRRDESAAFSFLIAIPTILAAGGYDLFKSRELLLNSISLLPVLAAGFIAAFAVAYVAVKWFIRYLEHHTLNLFGFYRLLAGAGLILLLLLT